MVHLLSSTSPLLAVFLATAAFVGACGPSEESGAGGEKTPNAIATAAPATTAADPATSTSPAVKELTPAQRGATLFQKYCALCHGANAEGYAADNAPSLVSSTFVATASDDFLRAGIERGRPGTAMGGFGRVVGGPLDAVDVDAIIAFIHSKNTTPVQPPAPYIGGGDIDNGRAVYERECQKCHGTTTQRGNAVHLPNPLFLATATDSFIRHAIVFGRPGTPMESFAPRLDGRATNDVVAYIRSLALHAPTLGELQPPSLAPPPPEAQAPFTAPANAGGQIPQWTSIPLNPQGGAPTFHLRDGRFAPMAEVKKALDDKKRIIIVDARPPSDWTSLHITGSVSLPYYNLELIDRIPNDDTWVIAYCGCPHHASGEVVDALRRKGYKNTAVLDEGMFAWQKAGYPVVQAPGMANLAAPPTYKDDKPQPLPAPPSKPKH